MNDNERLDKGLPVFVNGKVYALCKECGSLVRLNKPFIGSMHLCSASDETE